MSDKKQERKQFWVILIIVFLGFIGISMPYLIFPSLFLNPSYSMLPVDLSESSRALFLGLTLAVYPLGQFIGSPILGALSDDYGRKWLLSGSLFITAICSLFSGFAIVRQDLIMLIVSRFLAGLMEGNIAIARAMAADLKTISKHETFGKINASTSIAFLIGPLVGGLMTDGTLYKGFSMSTPFFVISIFFVGLALLSGVMLKKSVGIVPAQVHTFWQRINFIKRMSLLFSNKQVKLLLLASTFFTLAVDIFYQFGPVYLTVKWTYAPSQLIIFNAMLCIALVIGNGWLPSLFSSTKSNKLPITCAIGGFAAIMGGVVLANSIYLMLFLFFISGLAIGLAVTLITVKISNAASDRIQGEVMGVQLSLRVLGDGIICLLGGVLLILSPKLILIVSGAIALSAMVYYRAKHRA